jgi:hypothetical protein
MFEGKYLLRVRSSGVEIGEDGAHGFFFCFGQRDVRGAAQGGCMRQRVDHVGDDEDGLVEVAASLRLQLALAGCDGETEGSVEAGGEVACGVGPVWDLRGEECEELGISGVGIDHSFDQGPDESVERGRGVFDQRALDDAIDVADVALVQGDEDGAFVGEVLIDGADADSCDLGDVVGCEVGGGIALQSAKDSIEDRVDCLMGSALLGAASG